MTRHATYNRISKRTAGSLTRLRHCDGEALQSRVSGYAGVASGFTLVEVVIAALLLLLCMSLTLYSFVSFKRSATLAESHLTALQLAHNEAEQLQTNSFTGIGSATNVITNASIVYTLNRRLIITTNNYKDVTISVEWMDPASTMRQALTNYITICNMD